MSAPKLTPDCFDRIRTYVKAETGIAVADSKSYLIETRFTEILEAESLDSFERLCEILEQGPPRSLIDKLVNAITTNETLWFRDEGPWEILRKKLLPEFCEALTSGKKKKIRIWSAASSTGQEPYSVAMLIREHLEADGSPHLKPESFEIIATDISSDALAIAKLGEYELLAASRGITPELMERFFEQKGESLRVNHEIKSMVRFQQFDLQRSFMGFGTLDLILCRNVLIYFSNELKAEILEKTSRALSADGALILGGAESAQGAAKLLKMARAGRHLYYTPKGKETS